MAKFHSPLLGYNNNVRHRGRLFHIQTEDSGINHPHVITHLFMDGGRILKSVKKSYAEHVGSETMKDTVRVLMKEQHKAMFIALRDGQFDELVDGKRESNPNLPPVAVPEPPATQPDVVAAPPSSAEPAPNTIRAEVPPVSQPAAPSEPFALDGSGPNTVPERKGIQSIPPATQQEPRRPSAEELTLDFDALERDSAPGNAPMFTPNDLPPPPANLFTKERGTGAYKKVELGAHHDDTRAPAAPPPRRASLPPTPKGESGRYASTRPAAIFGSNSKPPAPSSMFGDELVSDKSLDEVILSYLAEDLEPRK